MKARVLPTGETVSALGLGTWRMGERRENRVQEMAAIRLALDLGMTVIDTAEMYADGGAEELVGHALSDGTSLRDRAFLVSKVYPQNASRAGVVAACERSLRRLRTDRIELYLLHWRGQYPLAETVAGFEALRRAGKIRYWGVSNLDLSDMQELWGVPQGSGAVVNQVLYNLGRRGVEWDLLPWLQKHQVLTMAYSPLDQARLMTHEGLGKMAQEKGMTSSQLALAWLLRQAGVIAIPKSARPERLREFAKAAEFALSAQDLGQLDRLFSPPERAVPLEML